MFDLSSFDLVVPVLLPVTRPELLVMTAARTFSMLYPGVTPAAETEDAVVTSSAILCTTSLLPSNLHLDLVETHATGSRLMYRSYAQKAP